MIKALLALAAVLLAAFVVAAIFVGMMLYSSASAYDQCDEEHGEYDMTPYTEEDEDNVIFNR